ncbi:MAG: hypothetical protein PHQ66_00700 [Candidatus Nanoarchaeia archaeon]|nr:hypothetical protein [Candidatus Nanoarchaeia archaeon]MDD5358503.1 hypothetical protein [Candidatus Nanoarchaeia archaeon]MDD5589017.1 hypothetical protein [Candidatus Nanoarchaeia archaeon]
MEEDKIAELTVEQLIKIILGILVVVAVSVGLYFFFKDKIIEFFQGLSPPEIFRVLINDKR